MFPVLNRSAVSKKFIEESFRLDTLSRYLEHSDHGKSKPLSNANGIGDWMKAVS